MIKKIVACFLLYFCFISCSDDNNSTSKQNLKVVGVIGGKSSSHKVTKDIQIGTLLYVTGYQDNKWVVVEVDNTVSPVKLRTVKFNGSTSVKLSAWISPMLNSFMVGTDTYIIFCQRLGTWNQSNSEILIFKRGAITDTTVAFSTSTDHDLTNIKSFLDTTTLQVETEGTCASEVRCETSTMFIPETAHFDGTTMFIVIEYWKAPNSYHYHSLYKSDLVAGVFQAPVPVKNIYSEKSISDVNAVFRAYSANGKLYINQLANDSLSISIDTDPLTFANESSINQVIGFIPLVAKDMYLITGVSSDGKDIYIGKMNANFEIWQYVMLFSMVGPRSAYTDQLSGYSSFPIWSGQMEVWHSDDGLTNWVNQGVISLPEGI
jgi:hypothetical protein